MKKIVFFLITILVLFLIADDYKAESPVTGTNPLPFVSGNDTLIVGSNLYSRVLDLTKFRGAFSIGFYFDQFGDSASTIDIYYQGRLSGMSWGVPYDSLGADSLHIASVDLSSYDKKTFWIPMAKESWWGYHDEGRFILDGAADLDSTYVKARTKDQK